jgi:cytochrome bd-type quinol oxidase subunit 2
MMQPARFIAKLIGPLYLAIGVGILLNGSFYSALVAEAVKSPTLIYFSGLLALVPGLAIINMHTGWRGWPVVVTIIGWLLVIGGVIRLVLPATTATIAGDIYSNAATLLIVSIVLIVVGAFLTVMGYRSSK